MLTERFREVKEKKTHGTNPARLEYAIKCSPRYPRVCRSHPNLRYTKEIRRQGKHTAQNHSQICIKITIGYFIKIFVWFCPVSFPWCLISLGVYLRIRWDQWTGLCHLFCVCPHKNLKKPWNTV